MSRKCKEVPVELHRSGRRVADLGAALCSSIDPGGALRAESVRPTGGIVQLLIDHFRCPADGLCYTVDPHLNSGDGYFKFGPDALCYGQSASATPAHNVTDLLPDVGADVSIQGSTVQLPFDPAQVIDNLRLERYHPASPIANGFLSSELVRKMYYAVRPGLSVAVRRHLQKLYLRGWDQIQFPKWPVDTSVENILETLLAFGMRARKISAIPFIWFWPEGYPSCTMMTHDVETPAGLRFCPRLIDLDDSFGVKSSFQLIPEKRYTITPSILEDIRGRGFEVNVHDSNHDGQLMRNRGEFLRRVERINAYGRDFNARGFRSAGMYRNADWYDALGFSYDMSIPTVAHLEPQQGGCCTVFPFFIGNILELPLTTIQDYSLFHILKLDSIDLWKTQIARIRSKSGLISFIVHPDYIIEHTARRIYTQLLAYLQELHSCGHTWLALPGEVAEWWRLRSRMQLFYKDRAWHVAGEGSERATVAYAVLRDGGISYDLAGPTTSRGRESASFCGPSSPC